MRSLAEVEAWMVSWYRYGHQSNFCSMTLTNITERSGEPQHSGYWPGLEMADGWNLTWQVTVTYPAGAPPCSDTASVGATIFSSRTAQCPLGTTQTGSLSQCEPSGKPDPQKQQGRICKSCRGKTVKQDPIDVSDGNNYVAETDYEGSAGGALKFERAYNSRAAYAKVTNSSSAVGLTLMGAGWSATYFQYLMPVTITENGVTSTTVYAYRPDGRVLAFNLYNGAYSPEGDVGASLVQTNDGGWEYQTTDDTIETYDAAGQLTSIARRGQSPVTVNYSSGAQLGDPPTSVSDAFGHSLQFSYLYDQTNTQRLASITDPSGKTIQYAYNSYGDLASVTYQDGTKRSYGYDNNYALTSETDESSVVYRSWTYTSWTAQVSNSQEAGGVNDYTFSYSLT